MLNSVEASTQPCLTPRKLAIILDPCKHTIVELTHHCYEFGSTAKLCHNFPKSLTTDCVNALIRSTKVMSRSSFCFWHFSWSCRAVKIMSIVPRFFLNPHWLSGRKPDCWRCSFNRFSRTLARIFPATDDKEMLRCLSQTWWFPFFLDWWVTVLPGMPSFLHIMWNNSVSLSATGGPPAL